MYAWNVFERVEKIKEKKRKSISFRREIIIKQEIEYFEEVSRTSEAKSIRVQVKKSRDYNRIKGLIEGSRSCFKWKIENKGIGKYKLLEKGNNKNICLLEFKPDNTLKLKMLCKGKGKKEEVVNGILSLPNMQFSQQKLLSK